MQIFLFLFVCLFHFLFISTKTPGPGTYEVTHPNTSRKRMPAYTMNGRNYMPTDTTLKPGPGQHSPEKVGLHNLGLTVVSI